jgi:hypothetical protein
MNASFSPSNPIPPTKNTAFLYLNDKIAATARPYLKQIFRGGWMLHVAAGMDKSLVAGVAYVYRMTVEHAAKYILLPDEECQQPKGKRKGKGKGKWKGKGKGKHKGFGGVASSMPFFGGCSGGDNGGRGQSFFFFRYS